MSFKVQIFTFSVVISKRLAAYPAPELLRNHGKSVRFPLALSTKHLEHWNWSGLLSCYGGTRRLTRVDAQFSGDESRRLFANGAKVAESTAENRNLGVITYGSVVFQLKDANLEANNICDFVFRGMRVVCRTRVVTVCLFCLSAVPILMLIYGEWRKLNNRPLLWPARILEIFSLALIQLRPIGRGRVVSIRITFPFELEGREMKFFCLRKA